jgi:hypothetical protein
MLRLRPAVEKAWPAPIDREPMLSSSLSSLSSSSVSAIWSYVDSLVRLLAPATALYSSSCKRLANSSSSTDSCIFTTWLRVLRLRLPAAVHCAGVVPGVSSSSEVALVLPSTEGRVVSVGLWDPMVLMTGLLLMSMGDMAGISTARNFLETLISSSKSLSMSEEFAMTLLEMPDVREELRLIDVVGRLEEL